MTIAKRFKHGTLWFDPMGEDAWQHISDALNIAVYKRSARRWVACEQITCIATHGCKTRKDALHELSRLLWRETCAMRNRANALKFALTGVYYTAL